MCDVEKMFHRFQISKEDQDYQQYLWWEGGNTDSNYGMKYLPNQNESVESVYADNGRMA